MRKLMHNLQFLVDWVVILDQLKQLVKVLDCRWEQESQVAERVFLVINTALSLPKLISEPPEVAWGGQHVRLTPE